MHMLECECLKRRLQNLPLKWISEVLVLWHSKESRERTYISISTLISATSMKGWISTLCLDKVTMANANKAPEAWFQIATTNDYRTNQSYVRSFVDEFSYVVDRRNFLHLDYGPATIFIKEPMHKIRRVTNYLSTWQRLNCPISICVRIYNSFRRIYQGCGRRCIVSHWRCSVFGKKLHVSGQYAK